MGENSIRQYHKKEEVLKPVDQTILEEMSTQEPPTTVTQEPPTTQDPTTGVKVSTCNLKDPGELKMLEIPGCGGWVDLSCDKGCLNIQKVIKHYKGKRMK